MSGRWARLVCRLRGHQKHGYRISGGWPTELFTVHCSCRRCGEDLSVSMPSQFTIINDRAGEQ